MPRHRPCRRGLYTVEVAVAVGRQEECGGGRAPAVGGEPGALYILICLSHYTIEHVEESSLSYIYSI